MITENSPLPKFELMMQMEVLLNQVTLKGKNV